MTAALDGMPPPMIGKPLAVLAFGADAVALPRFAQLAPGATIARTASLMMHEVQPFSPPAAGGGVSHKTIIIIQSRSDAKEFCLSMSLSNQKKILTAAQLS